jgi:hypothetical protein
MADPMLLQTPEERTGLKKSRVLSVLTFGETRLVSFKGIAV